jgi:hypothetical protein
MRSRRATTAIDPFLFSSASIDAARDVRDGGEATRRSCPRVALAKSR